jgi:ParB-like chromosome segregation protein Spo0J
VAELREVKLERIHPNPFRDGQGGNPPATWESLEKYYEYDEKKLKELMDSYAANGVWAGIHARQRKDGEYELAFGHHRAEAARRLKIKNILIILGHYSDDEMLKMMAAENSEEYGHDFALGVMNAVEAVVKAYGEGKVELERPSTVGTHIDALYSAPSFVRGGTRAGPSYTSVTVGRYLGWMRTEDKSSHRVVTALSALELIEKGALTRGQLKGLGSSQARELVQVTLAAMAKEEALAETQRRFLAEAAAVAAKEGNKNKVEKLKAKLAEHEEHAAKAVLGAGLSMANTVKEFHKTTESFAQAVREAAADKKVELPKKVERAPVEDITAVDNYTAYLGELLKDEDPKFAVVLKVAPRYRGRRLMKELEEALANLARRAILRRRALRKALK